MTSDPEAAPYNRGRDRGLQMIKELLIALSMHAACCMYLFELLFPPVDELFC